MACDRCHGSGITYTDVGFDSSGYGTLAKPETHVLCDKCMNGLAHWWSDPTAVDPIYSIANSAKLEKLLKNHASSTKA